MKALLWAHNKIEKDNKYFTYILRQQAYYVSTIKGRKSSVLTRKHIKIKVHRIY